MKRYTDLDMGKNFLLGAFMPIAVFILTWHLAESVCQSWHDVSDCEISAELFVPAVQEVAE